MFPKPVAETTPGQNVKFTTPGQKVSFVIRVGDLGCAVGYFWGGQQHCQAVLRLVADCPPSAH
jgi:hypothetical protein